MVHVLDTSPQGGDAGLRRIQAEITDLARELSDLRATVGRYGAVYDRNGITIQNGGNIVGEGGGHLEWSGAAHFGGDTTIDGNLNLASGIIGASALSEQVSGIGVRATSTTRPTATWTTRATASVAVPTWASQVFIFATGMINFRLNINSSQYPDINYRLAINGVNSFTRTGFGFTSYQSGSSTWGQLISDPPETIPVTLATHTAYAPAWSVDPENLNAVNVLAMFLR